MKSSLPILAACAALCVPQARAHEPTEPVLDAIVVEGQRHNGIGNSDAARIRFFR